MIHYIKSTYRHPSQAVCKSADNTEGITTKDYRVNCGKCIAVLKEDKRDNIWNRSSRLAGMALPVSLAGPPAVLKGTI